MSSSPFDPAATPDHPSHTTAARVTGRFARAPRGVVLLCPGQGQLPRDLARDLRASDDDLTRAFHDHLGSASVDDPLRDYASTQAALVAIGVGRARRAMRLIAESPASPQTRPVLATAGHSLGELVALFAAGVISGSQAVQLAAERGGAFDRARTASWDRAGMMALTGQAVHEAVGAGLLTRHRVEFANDNAPDQIVVAGRLTDLQALKEEAAGLGLRAVRLETTGPSHSSYLRAAVPDFLASLRAASFAEAEVPVYANLTGRPFTDVAPQLATLLAAPVRWRETLLHLAELRPALVLDVGPGRALAKMAGKAVPGVTAVGLDDLVGIRVTA